MHTFKYTCEGLLNRNVPRVGVRTEHRARYVLTHNVLGIQYTTQCTGVTRNVNVYSRRPEINSNRSKDRKSGLDVLTDVNLKVFNRKGEQMFISRETKNTILVHIGTLCMY